MISCIIIFILFSILIYINLNFNNINYKEIKKQSGGSKLNIKSRKDCENFIHKMRISGRLCDDTEEHIKAIKQCKLLDRDCIEPIRRDLYKKDKNDNYINAQFTNERYFLTNKKKLDKQYKSNFCLSGNVKNASLNFKNKKERKLPKKIFKIINNNTVLTNINNKSPGKCNDKPWATNKISCLDILGNIKNVGDICRDSKYYKLALKACNTLSDQQIKNLSDPNNPKAVFYNIQRKLISGEEKGCLNKFKRCEHFTEKQCDSEWFNERCKFDKKNNQCVPQYVTHDNCNLDNIIKDPKQKLKIKKVCDEGTIESYKKANKMIETVILKKLKEDKI